MNDTATFPSLDLGPYPMHDRDGFLEFALGMWFNTRHIVGKPPPQEVVATLPPDWPKDRLRRLLITLERTRQLG